MMETPLIALSGSIAVSVANLPTFLIATEVKEDDEMRPRPRRRRQSTVEVGETRLLASQNLLEPRGHRGHLGICSLPHGPSTKLSGQAMATSGAFGALSCLSGLSLPGCSMFGLCLSDRIMLSLSLPGPMMFSLSLPSSSMPRSFLLLGGLVCGSVSGGLLGGSMPITFLFDGFKVNYIVHIASRNDTVLNGVGLDSSATHVTTWEGNGSNSTEKKIGRKDEALDGSHLGCVQSRRRMRGCRENGECRVI